LEDEVAPSISEYIVRFYAKNIKEKESKVRN
jgi:hypothetical protein